MAEETPEISVQDATEEPKLVVEDEEKPSLLGEQTPKENEGEFIEGKESIIVSEKAVSEETAFEEEDVNSVEDADTGFQAPEFFGEMDNVGVGIPIDLISEYTVEEEEVPDEDIMDYLVSLGLQKEEKPPIDREYYEAEYHLAKEKKVDLRRKNGLLNKRVTEYYKRKKAQRVFEEVFSDVYEGLLERYESKVDDFYEYRITTTREREAIDNELNDMTVMRNDLLSEFDRIFEDMLRREKDIGHGLIDTNGKVVPDKYIDRLLSRQRVKMGQIAEIRLSYIKRRDHIREIEAKLKSLETIGGTLHLLDFEQLRMENQTFSDKIEERDDELMKLRARYAYCAQALSHTREKISVIEEKIEELSISKNEGEFKLIQVRERLNVLKIQRDSNRAQAVKLKTNSGILTYPKVLLDMEKTLQEISRLQEELEQLKTQSKITRNKIKYLRHNIEKFERMQREKCEEDEDEDIIEETNGSRKHSKAIIIVKDSQLMKKQRSTKKM